MVKDDIKLPTREGLRMIRQLCEQEKAREKKVEEEREKKKAQQDTSPAQVPAHLSHDRMMKVVVGTIHNAVKQKKCHVSLSPADFAVYRHESDCDGVVYEAQKRIIASLAFEIDASDDYSASWVDPRLHIYIRDAECAAPIRPGVFFWSDVQMYMFLLFSVLALLWACGTTGLMVYYCIKGQLSGGTWAAWFLFSLACCVFGGSGLIGASIEGYSDSNRAELQMRKKVRANDTPSSTSADTVSDKSEIKDQHAPLSPPEVPSWDDFFLSQ